MLVVFLSASVGFWKFIGEVSNLRNASAVVTMYNTPFVPAVPGGPDVISFLGQLDSYVVLENNGDLAVSSFTWAAKVFPENTIGPLFEWHLNSDKCWHFGPHMWIHYGNFFFGACTITDALARAEHTTAILTGVWYDVAVSHDAVTGATRLRVDNVTETFTVNTGSFGSTEGPVVMGSRYHFISAEEDSRSFQGKMACVRMWKVVRDVSTLHMDSPMCKINA